MSRVDSGTDGVEDTARGEALTTALRERFATADQPIAVAAAPGRVNLIGGHTDYNEGFVLPVAIDQQVFVAARRRTDETLQVHTTAFDETCTTRLGADWSDLPGWSHYVLGVAQQLADGQAESGVDLVIDGDVPLGAGLSSSAALELATATALQAVWNTSFGPRELALRCWRAEREGVGVECGIMDQFAVTFGERDSAVFLDCRSQEHEHVPLDEDVRVLVTNTNVEHELVDSAYNERVAQCREAVERFDDLLDEDVDALRDVSVGQFETHRDRLPETVRDRCEHVVRENERVRAARDALRRGDIDHVGTLMRESHESLRDLYEVSCPELDAVVDAASAVSGTVGSRMTGAGFGGCVVSLVRADATDRFVEEVGRTYAEAVDVEPDIYDCSVAAGCRRL